MKKHVTHALLITSAIALIALTATQFSTFRADPVITIPQIPPTPNNTPRDDIPEAREMTPHTPPNTPREVVQEIITSRPANLDRYVDELAVYAQNGNRIHVIVRAPLSITECQRIASSPHIEELHIQNTSAMKDIKRKTMLQIITKRAGCGLRYVTITQNKKIKGLKKTKSYEYLKQVDSNEFKLENIIEN